MTTVVWSGLERNKQLNATYDTSLNVQKLLALDQEKRSCSHLLSDAILNLTPLRNTSTPPEIMKEAALSMKTATNYVDLQRKKAEEKRRKKERENKESESSLLEGLPLSKLDKGKEVVVHSTRPKKKRRGEVLKLDDSLVDQDNVVCTLPLDGSFLNDPADLLDEAKKLFLPEDQKRIASFGLKTATDRGLTTMMQGIQYYMSVASEARDQKNLIDSYERELANAKSELEKLNTIRDEFEEMKGSLLEAKTEAMAAMEKASKSEKMLQQVQAELQLSKDLVLELEQKNEDLLEAKEDAEINVGAKIQYQFMAEFIEHGGKDWDAHQAVADFEAGNPDEPLVLSNKSARGKEGEEADHIEGSDNIGS